MARFLISRLSSLGDVVCCLPAAAALKKGFPGCTVSWAVDPRFAGVVECCGSVDEVVPCAPGMSASTWPTFEGVYDAVLDLQGLLKSAICVARARSEKKLGYHWQREGSWMFSQKVLPDPTSFHVVDQYVDVARAAGGAADRAEFALKPDESARESIKATLRRGLEDFGPSPSPTSKEADGGGVGKPMVVLNPGAGWASKRWPAKYFGELIDRLTPDVLPVLIGGKGAEDRRAADEVLAQCKGRPMDLVGQTNLKELIALIDQSSAHVGGDTGSTHIAAALGRPAVGLYSITRPQRSCPYGQIERCHYDPAGLDRILPADVLDSVITALGEAA